MLKKLEPARPDRAKAGLGYYEDRLLSDDELTPRALMRRLTVRVAREIEEKFEAKKLISK